MTKVYKNAVPTKVSRVVTPQSKPIAGRESEMTKNYSGFYVFKLDEMSQLDRFLILGSSENTYYAKAQDLTEQNAANVISLIKKNGVAVVNRIVEISAAGRASKNTPALFALALAMTYGDTDTKAAAYSALPKVARIGTHLFQLADYVNNMRGWGRGMRNAFARWYNEKPAMELAKQVTKYANREGWTHADILRLAHVRPVTSTHDALFSDILGNSKNVAIDADVAEYMAAVYELKKTTSAKDAVKLIEKYKLPREVVPTELLNTKEVWESLLPHMKPEALVRNLATMTRVGIIGGAFSQGTKDVVAKLSDVDAVKNSKLHPIKVLAALLTYSAGRGVKGSNVWSPEKKITDALDDMFYMTFKNIVPTGKNRMLAIDVSSSMTCGDLGGVMGLSPHIASTVMAMVTARTEKNAEFYCFTSVFKKLNITERMTLKEAMRVTQDSAFGSTNCALPMTWATKNKIDVDSFEVYTDNDTNAGSSYYGYHRRDRNDENIQPAEALVKFRNTMNKPDAALLVVGMTATNFSIGDPNDRRTMNVVGFDTDAPSIMADFVRGSI